MMEAILKAVEIVTILLIGYFVLMGRKNNEDLDKLPLSFFILGLLFLMFSLMTSISLALGVETLLLNSTSKHIYVFLTPLSFFIGSLILRKESDSF